MTVAEKVYTAVVILCTGFVLVSLGSFHFVIIPAFDDETIGSDRH